MANGFDKRINESLNKYDVKNGTGQIDIKYVTITGTHTIQIRII